MSEFVGRPILFGFNPHRATTIERESLRQREQDETLCKSIQMWCCILFTVGCIIYLMIMVGALILVDSAHKGGNESGSQLDIIDEFKDGSSSSSDK